MAKTARTHRQLLGGKYQIVGELGAGGMGHVYLAQDVRLGRKVALKFIPQDEELRERFLREAQIMAKLSHPHIVPVFDFGEEGRYLFYSMAYIEGHNLAEFVAKKGRLRETEALELLLPLVQAVEYAHSLGVVHRDIKPENVLVSRDGTVFLADFGLARQVKSQTLTQTGAIVGTPQYIAPEQAQGQKVDERADLYSLGALLFFMLTGQPPFVKKDVMALLLAVATETPPPVSHFRTGVSREVEWILERCLEKKPQDRYPSARALRQDLERLLKGEPVSVGPPSLGRRLRRYFARHRRMVATFVFLLVVAGASWVTKELEQRSQRQKEWQKMKQACQNLPKPWVWRQSRQNFQILRFGEEELGVATEAGLWQMQHDVLQMQSLRQRLQKWKKTRYAKEAEQYLEELDYRLALYTILSDQVLSFQELKLRFPFLSSSKLQEIKAKLSQRRKKIRQVVENLYNKMRTKPWESLQTTAAWMSQLPGSEVTQQLIDLYSRRDATLSQKQMCLLALLARRSWNSSIKVQGRNLKVFEWALEEWQGNTKNGRDLDWIRHFPPLAQLLLPLILWSGDEKAIQKVAQLWYQDVLKQNHPLWSYSPFLPPLTVSLASYAKKECPRYYLFFLWVWKLSRSGEFFQIGKHEKHIKSSLKKLESHRNFQDRRNWPELLYLKGRLLYSLAKYKKGEERQKHLQLAQECFSQVVQKLPHWAEGYHHLGVVIFERFGPRKALPFLQKAQKMAPHNFSILVTLAVILSALGHDQQAEKFNLTALALAPTSYGVINNLLAIYGKQRNTKALDILISATKNLTLRSREFQLVLALVFARDFQSGFLSWECLQTALLLPPWFRQRDLERKYCAQLERLLPKISPLWQRRIQKALAKLKKKLEEEAK